MGHGCVWAYMQRWMVGSQDVCTADARACNGPEIFIGSSSRVLVLPIAPRLASGFGRLCYCQVDDRWGLSCAGPAGSHSRVAACALSPGALVPRGKLSGESTGRAWLSGKKSVGVQGQSIALPGMFIVSNKDAIQEWRAAHPLSLRKKILLHDATSHPLQQ